MSVVNFGTSATGVSVSPGVNVSEFDATNIAPAVPTTEAGIAGAFRWGPVDQVRLVTSESDLVNLYGRPTDFNGETFFTASSFLAYSNQLAVCRAANTSVTVSAVAATGVVNNQINTVKNSDVYDQVSGSFQANANFIAKYPGQLGNSLKISVCDSAAAFQSEIDLRGAFSNTGWDETGTQLSINVGSSTATLFLEGNSSVNATQSNTYVNNIAALLSVGDLVELGNNTIGQQFVKITNIGTPTVDGANATFTVELASPFRLSADFQSSTVKRYWEFFNLVDKAPGQSEFVASFGNTAANDELHVVLVDQGGKISGIAGGVLEVYAGLSRATDARSADGQSLYYKTALNDRSDFVWFGTGISTVSNTAVNVISSVATSPLTSVFAGGADGPDESTIAFGDLARAYDVIGKEQDLSLVIAGKSRGGTNGEQLANYLIDNIAELRRDCVVFCSPERADVVSNSGRESADVVQFRNSVRSSSYAVIDSGYKYTYDRYNDLYRWVPLNGDIAGLCALTDSVADPWFSPAGFGRGNLRNVIRLAFNPSKAERDQLYKNDVNPVITLPGQGTVLFGDKTALGRPSAFDRINVRRLFIYLQKSISLASQNDLFEFNDDETRSRFRSAVEPFLRDIQGRRGLTDFSVVCDETNNTPQVIDSNRFVADIFIKPTRSINFIQLNFTAARTGIEFSELVR